MGVSIPTMVSVIVQRVAPHRAGLVDGMVNSTLQVSAATGVAPLGGLFYPILGRRTEPAAVARGFAATVLLIAGRHAAGALLAAGPGQRRPAGRAARAEKSALNACEAQQCGRAQWTRAPTSGSTRTLSRGALRA